MKILEDRNAKISYTMLGIEDHGVMTFMIGLEWKGGGQGLGGYALDQGKPGTDDRSGFGPGFVAIRKILETVGVEKWEDLKGKLVRVRIDSLGSSTPPVIGHILEDQWFDLKKFIREEASNCRS